jgi:tetratricopeptide (TPR) repeat protein
MSAKRCAAAILILVFFGVGAAFAAAADNTLATARDLYAAAAYEDALVILNQLSGGTHGPDEERAIQQYRAFCLLALGRTADAEQAIAAVVAVQPRYQPADADVSPRVRATFAEVRKRVLPTVIQQQYAIAKSSYDRKNWSEAAERFNYVLDVLNDPDVRPAAAQPPLADLKVLAQGFRDLALTAATPPPAPPKPEPAPPAPTPVAAAAPESAAPAAPRIYQATDKGIVPPITVRQNLPPFPSTAAVPKQAQGVLEVIIDETGAVEQALIRVPLNAAFDRQALLAAKSWLYQPAMMNGKPVKFRKAVQINVAR